MRLGYLPARMRHFAASPQIQASVIYLGGNVLAALFPLLMLPVLTRYLTAAEYGLYALALVLVQFFFPFTSLGLSNAVARDFVDQDRIDFPRVVSMSIVLSSAAMIVLIVIVEVARLLRGASLFGEATSLPLLFFPAVYVMVASQIVLSHALALLQMKEKPLLYSALRIGSQIAFAIIAIFAVVTVRGGADGIILAKASADLLTIFACSAILFCYGYMVPRWNSSEARRILAYGIPLVPHMISVALIAIVDRLLLTHLMDISATGIFMAGYQIGMVMWLVVNSVNQAWMPWFFKAMALGTRGAKRRIVHVIYAIAMIYLAIAAAMAFIAPYIVAVLSGPDFQAAAPVASLIIVAFLFQGCYALFGSFLYYHKRPVLLSISSFATIVINVVASYFLIQSYGTVGAALGTILAYLLSFLFVAFFAVRTSPMPWLAAFTFEPRQLAQEPEITRKGRNNKD